jgi:uncharacterized protein YjcR
MIGHSTEQIHKIARHYETSGLSTVDLARIYFISCSTIQSYIKRAGVKPKNKGFKAARQDMAQMVDDWNNGMDGWDIAHKYGYRDSGSVKTAICRYRKQGYGFMRKRGEA